MRAIASRTLGVSGRYGGTFMSSGLKVGLGQFSGHMALSCVRVGLKTAKKGWSGSGLFRQWACLPHSSHAVRGGVNW
jgi:hypothetical protein